jgi:type I restriction enzyme S subunit
MMEVKLKELCKLDQIGKYGIPASAEDFHKNKTRYLRITDIDDYGNLLQKDKKSVSSKDLDKYILQEGEIVFARTGNSTGRTYFHESKNGELAYAGFLIKFGLDSKKVNPKYLKYFTLSEEYKQWVRNLSVGSTRGNINAQTFADCPVIFPNRNQQDDLVNTLSDLDDKIELNNRINAELEAMAKLLYEYWFVQFDFPYDLRQSKPADKTSRPQDIKPYKSSGGKMVWNKDLNREIPEGWEVKELISVTSFLSRGISPTYLEFGGICVLNQKCVRDHKINYEFSRRHDHYKKNPSSKTVEKLDILVNSTGVGTLGRIGIVNWMIEDKVTVDSHVTIVRSDPEKINPFFNGFSLLQKQHEIESFSLGSTGQVELSRSQLEGVKLILPSRFLQDSFGLKYSNILERTSINQKQNQELSSLRDWLLPMLMNGQVTVMDAEERVSEELGMVAEGERGRYEKK